MLLDAYLNDLQKFTKEKITYEKVAKVLKLKGKQAVSMRITRKQELKDWEIELLDKEFKYCTTSTQNIAFAAKVNIQEDILKIPYWNGLPDDLKNTDFTCVTAERNVIQNHWNLNPDDLFIVPMVGDKMTNYWYKILPNDILIIDTSHNHIVGNGVYFATSQKNTRFWIREMQALINNDIQIKGFAPSGETTKIFTQEQLKEVDFKIIGKVIKNVSFRL